MASKDSLQKALLCAQAAIDKKAENVQILDLTEVSGFTDFFLICSAMSDRQVQAIADSVESRMKGEGIKVLSGEGYTEGRWAVIDLGDVVVHIFLDAIRDYYDLESLWLDAPKLKIPSDFYGPSATRLN